MANIVELTALVLEEAKCCTVDAVVTHEQQLLITTTFDATLRAATSDASELSCVSGWFCRLPSNSTDLQLSPLWQRRRQQYHEPFAALAAGAAVRPADELLVVLRWMWRVRWENQLKEPF